MKIGKVQFHNFRNDIHFQFHTEFRDFITKKGAQNLKIAKQFNEYLALYNKLDSGLKKINKSILTGKIQEADSARDVIWSGLVEMSRGATKHFDSAVREAADRLKIVFDTYGNLAAKTINAQTSATNNILQELEGNYAEDVKTAGLTQWVSELKARNAAVDSLVKERFEESADRSSVVVKEARTELDKHYCMLVDIINVLVIIEEDISIYEDFIKVWNAVVVKYGGGKRIPASSDSDYPVPPEIPEEPVDPFDNAREWTRILKADDFKLGDIFYIAEPNVPKKYYELIDEEHYYYFPNSDEGTLAWKKLIRE